MTREHKLALIVGFALILVVGVFVSDHFSKARLAKPGDQLATSAGMPTAHQNQPVAFPKPEPPTTMTSVPPSPPAHQPGEMVNGERPKLVGEFAGDVGSRGVPGFSGSGDVRLNPPAKDLPAAVSVVDVHGEGSMPLPVPPSSTPRGSERPSGPAPKPALPVSSGDLRTHTVVRGDSLAKLAARYYSDEKLWRRLAEYNASRVGAGANVNTGVTLMIPPRDVLLGQATLAPEGSRRPAPTPPKAQPATARKPDPKAAPKPLERTYTVKSGDTLALIAERELGSGKRRREIQKLNAGLLDDEDTIAVGMVLKLPAKG